MTGINLYSSDMANTKTQTPATVAALRLLMDKADTFNSPSDTGYQILMSAYRHIAKELASVAPTKRGFVITRRACIVCGEPPFGDEYCCGHSQDTAEPGASENA